MLQQQQEEKQDE